MACLDYFKKSYQAWVCTDAWLLDCFHWNLVQRGHLEWIPPQISNWACFPTNKIPVLNINILSYCFRSGTALAEYVNVVNNIDLIWSVS